MLLTLELTPERILEVDAKRATNRACHGADGLDRRCDSLL